MRKNDLLTRILAIAGTALAWFPVAAPILLSVMKVLTRRVVRMDFLMPAELFLFALVGGGLLLWACLRARSLRKLIGWSYGIAIGSLIGGQALAVITGLASGETEPAGWQWMLVIATLAIYSLALIALGVGGILLLRDLFKEKMMVTPKPGTPLAEPAQVAVNAPVSRKTMDWAKIGGFAGGLIGTGLLIIIPVYRGGAIAVILYTFVCVGIGTGIGIGIEKVINQIKK